MKLLFFISTLENDGAERAMSNITTHLPEDVEADILLNSVSEHDFSTGARIINLGMKPDCIKGLGYQLAAFCKRIPMLYQLKKNNNYDACISFMESANICNIITGNKYCKTIVSVRVRVEQDDSFSYKYIVRPLIRLFYKKADRIVAVAEGVRQGMIEYFKLNPAKIKTVTNGYDVKQIQSFAKEQNILQNLFSKENFIFVTVGRMMFQKAHWHLIRAFAEVVKKCPNAKLIIIGQGEEEKYLDELISAYNLEDKVVLMPYQKNPFSILSKCTVFIMPSMFEGYCNALCEALICGLPCIATDFQSSAREILAPNTSIELRNTNEIEYAQYGILTPVCSGKKYGHQESLEMQEKKMAEAMVMMYNKKELLEKYQNAAVERGEQLDISKKVQEWLALVKE